MSRGVGRNVMAFMLCVLMGLAVLTLPQSFDTHQVECEHQECPVAHGCCAVHAPAILPSACVILDTPIFTSCPVRGLLFNVGIAASSVPFQPPRV
jgi:hypothetical protein